LHALQSREFDILLSGVTQTITRAGELKIADFFQSGHKFTSVTIEQMWQMLLLPRSRAAGIFNLSVLLPVMRQSSVQVVDVLIESQMTIDLRIDSDVEEAV
jgi:hypothetical protein